MATASTEKKAYRQESGKRTTVADMEAHTTLAYDMDAEDVWALISKNERVVGGLDISFNSGFDFDISAGIAVIGGEVLKTTGVITRTLDENTDPSNTRIDVVTVNGASIATVDGSTAPVMGSTSINTETDLAIGTGDGSTTEFSLLNPKVRPEKLIVKVAGTVVSGWVFKPGSHLSTSHPNDSILFDTPPAMGDAITASFINIVGGEEVTPGGAYNTRYAYNANIVVNKGTPGSPASIPSGEVLLGTIEVPASWSGGSTGVTITNSKAFLLGPDQLNDNASPFTSPPRIEDCLRNMGQVRHGCRLRYENSTTIKVGPGWINHRGMSMRSSSDVTLTLQNSNSAAAGYIDPAGSPGWLYVYAIPPSLPGFSFTIDTDTAAPTSMREGAGISFYLGAIYVTDVATPAIREFYTHNNWTYWSNPTATSFLSSSTATSASNDIDIAAWCPPTGRLVDVGMNATWTLLGGSVGDRLDLVMQSHKGSGSGYSYNKPDFQIYQVAQVTSGAALFDNRRGVIRAEQDGATRKVSYAMVQNTTGGGGNSVSANWWVNGFKDDYTTMASTGSAVLPY